MLILSPPEAFSSTIRWPLGPTVLSPMHYQSLEDMKAIRGESIGDMCSSQPVIDLVSGLPGNLDSWFPIDRDDDGGNRDGRDFGHIATALLLLGSGFTDECHDLITPLSWSGDLDLANGPSVFRKASLEAQAYATYVHCLVHRKEAFHIGEFGMVGFANANYWSNAVKRSKGLDMLPHEEWRQAVLDLSSASPFSTHGPVREWCQRHGFDSEVGSGFFESRAVHELCAEVLRKEGSDAVLREFAETLVASEIRILMENALKKAGYDTSTSH